MSTPPGVHGALIPRFILALSRGISSLILFHPATRWKSLAFPINDQSLWVLPFAEIITEKSPGMLLIMTINTKVLPIWSIWWIVPVVSILVMNREKMPVLIIKLSRAFCANEPVNVQGPFSVIAFWYCTFFQFSYDLINVLTTIFFFRPSSFLYWKWFPSHVYSSIKYSPSKYSSV